MFRLNAEITIEENTFNSAIDIEVISTWQNLIDTARIVVPDKFVKDNTNITVGDEGFFKRGNAITVKAGYFPNLEVIFEGYIRMITVEENIVIMCEDAGWLLKQRTFTKGYKNTKLLGLLQDIIPDEVAIDAADSELGAFVIDRSTALQVLDELKETYGLVSYFKGNTLRVGLAYRTEDQTELGFDTELNVADASGLEFIDSSELLIVIQGISMQPNNTKIERFAYYEKGEIKLSDTNPGTGEIEKFDVRGIPAKDIDFYITRHLEKRLSTGIRGSFTAFLEPKVEHGNVVKLKNRKHPEMDGKYLVKQVITRYGNQGAWQDITLDTKVG